MIEFGKKKTKVFSSGNQPTIEVIKGYYLVRESDGHRFFISEEINGFALENVAKRVLNDKTGYNYWIDYCIGYDINRVLAWSNLDFINDFI